MAFIPFDDTQYVPPPVENTKQGMDISAYEHLLQGVEIRNSKQLYIGTQPKIWSGNLNHQIKVATYGQAVSNVDYQGSLLYKDLPRFNPVAYIVLGDNYPLPIVFNNGPQDKEEASMEPFTIPFLKNTNEGPFYAHSVNAQLEDGNDFLTRQKSSNRVQQFIELKTPVQSSYFLDMGEENFGGIVIEGFVPNTLRLSYGFDDTLQDFVVDSVQTNDATFKNELIKLEIDLDGDLRPYNHKSATAGFIYTNSSFCGTDSLCFGGFLKGC